ncbi:putative Manno protein MP88 [Mycena leptocephala]|nr:putative Manno protein MP88 [Mycena leptocephala]
MFSSVLLLASTAVASVRAAYPAGVVATGTQGVTNPPVPTMPTIINQTSIARLLSVNSIDDFCLFGPPILAAIPDTETEEIAWCTMPRNNARVIPDGTITGVSFLKTDFYVQIMGTGDFTNINIQKGDSGGELDPHGAEGTGNPVGGNVTTTVADGTDLPIAEWMLYISDSQFCLRACYNANSTYSAAFMCWHELDVMGCEFVMPGTYNPPGTFETCDAEVAYPPGWYPTVVDGTTSFSTFAQFFTGVYTGADGQPTPYTVGDTVTPDAPFSTPSSSNCVTKATISNGIAASLLTANAVGTALPDGFSSSTPLSAPTGTPAGEGASASGGSVISTSKKATTPAAGSTGASGAKSTGGASASNSGTAPGTSGSSAGLRSSRVGYDFTGEFAGIALVSLFAGLAAIGLLH